jgi:hypothetical protein
MNRKHIEAWKEYLVGELHERYGIAKEEAQRTVARWLRSLAQRSALEAQAVPERVDRPFSLRVKVVERDQSRFLNN